MSDLNDYYLNYYKQLGDGAYKMQKWQDSSRVLFLKQFIESYLQPDDKILDVGCGDSHLSQVLPKYDWTGIDLNTEASKNVDSIAHDLMKAPYPLPDHSFQGVVCSEVLEHLWDLRVVHREVKRILKPGGTYIVSTPNYDHIDHYFSNFQELLFNPDHPHLFEHIRQYNYHCHKRFLEEAGFKIVSHVGCDAQYTKFFQVARNALHLHLNKALQVPHSVGEVDQLIGTMFPEFNHTIMIVCQA